MHPYLTSMPPEHIFGYLVGAVTALVGAIVWLYKNQVSRSDRDKLEIKGEFETHKKETKEKIELLDSRLFDTLQKKQEAELKAIEWKMAARQPCILAECPRRNQSFSVGEKAEGVI